MGRKRAIVVGFLVEFAACIGLGLAARIPDYNASVFTAYVILMRAIQGFGESLQNTACFSVINLIFSEERIEKLAQTEAAFGLGMMIGPSIGSFVFGAVGYEYTFYFFALQILLSMAQNACALPESLNFDGEIDFCDN